MRLVGGGTQTLLAIGFIVREVSLKPPHIRFVFNGLEDLRPLVKSTTEEELRKLLERLPRRTEADMWDEVMRVTNNQSDQEMLQVHVTESRNTVHWLASKGHDWVPAGGFKMPSDNILLMNGQMSDATHALIKDTLTRITAKVWIWPKEDTRVHMAIRLLMASPEYLVQK